MIRLSDHQKQILVGALVGEICRIYGPSSGERFYCNGERVGQLTIDSLVRRGLLVKGKTFKTGTLMSKMIYTLSALGHEMASH